MSQQVPGLTNSDVFYSNRAGIASSNLSAPGMQSNVENWLKTQRPSADSLLKQAEATAPKAPGMKPLQAPGLMDRASTLLSKGAQAAKASADPIVKAGLKGNAKSLLTGKVGDFAKGSVASPLGMMLIPGMAVGAIDNQIQGHVNQVRAASPGLTTLPKKAPTANAGAPVAAPGLYARDGAGQYYAPGSYTADGGKSIVAMPQPDNKQAPGLPAAEKPALDPRSMPPTKLDKNDPNNPINQALAKQRAESQGFGLTKQANGVPLYGSNTSNPAEGMNTVPGLSGQVGNVSTVSVDRDAIERGNQADRELHAARMADVHGGRAEDYLPGGKADGGEGQRANDLIQRALRSRNPQLIQAVGNVLAATKPVNPNEARLGMQAKQLDNSTKAMAQQEQQQLAKLRGDYMALNDTNDPGGAKRKQLAAQLMTLQGKAPGLENKFKVVELGGGNDSNGMPLPKTGYVFNQETGQYQPMQTPGAAGANAAPYAEGTELIGKDGNRYVVKNGQAVLKT